MRSGVEEGVEGLAEEASRAEGRFSQAHNAAAGFEDIYRVANPNPF